MLKFIRRKSFGVRSSTTVIGLLRFCIVAATLTGVGNVLCQETKTETKTVTRQTKDGIESFSYNLIPDATEPCTAVECAWWKHLRTAGNDLQKTGNEFYKKKFVTLFVEGLEKSYRIPVKDQPMMSLVLGPRPKVAGVGRTKKNGTIELSVEYRADASIGDVTVVKGLDPEVDQLYVRSTRQILFLPAIKNHAFVDERNTIKFHIFHSGWSK